MENKEKAVKKIYEKWWFWLIAVIAVVILSSSGDSSENGSSSGISKEATFASEARARFDGILKDSPELESITCEEDCTDVVYFNYKTLPSDLNFIIRGNAATFSKFKLEKTGVSHIRITARFSGRDVVYCRAAGGVVTECK